MNDQYRKLIVNWESFLEDNPDILVDIKNGKKVAVYDQETDMVIVAREGNLQVVRVDYFID